MKAMIWHGGDKFIEETMDDPKALNHQVVVKVDTVGPEMYITQGLFPKSPLLILGHEWSGTIVDVGNKEINLD